jgi:hypothetical protein
MTNGDGGDGLKAMVVVVVQHAWCFLTQPHLQIDRVTG